MTDHASTAALSPPQNAARQRALRNVLVCLALAGATLAVYWPAIQFGYVYDDTVLVRDNEHIKAGLSAASLRWAFAVGETDWVPLANLSYMLEVELFGLRPDVMHATNILFHVVNALLLLWVLSRMTGAFWPSAATAALFALHPLRVESVAWVAERRDVLSALFGLLTVAMYARYARRPALHRYLAVCALFALSLMSKQMLVTLPCALLLLDYWPLRRFGFTPSPSQGEGRGEGRAPDIISPGESTETRENSGPPPSLPPGGGERPMSRSVAWLIIEKIPLLALSAVDVVIALQSVGKYSATWAQAQQIPFSLRLSNAIISYIHYIIDTFVPRGLAVFYPFPQHIPAWQVAGAAALLAAITAIALWQLRRRPYLTVGWFWFLGMLFPTIGVLAHNVYARADRYTYLPSIGLLIMIVWLAAGWLRARDASDRVTAKRRFATAALALAASSALAVTSVMQLRTWRDPLTLWRHALAVTEGNYVGHYNLGRQMATLANHERAIEHFRQVIALRPQMTQAYAQLGELLTQSGRIDEAIAVYRQAIRQDEALTPARLALANLLMRQGKKQHAIDEYRVLLRYDDDEPVAHNNLGTLLVQMGEMDAAIAHLCRAADLMPTDVGVQFNAGQALFENRQWREAARYLQHTLQLNPQHERAKQMLRDAKTAIAQQEDAQ